MLYKHDVANIIVRSTALRNCGIGEKFSHPQFDVTADPRDKARVDRITNVFPLVFSFITSANPALST